MRLQACLLVLMSYCLLETSCFTPCAGENSFTTVLNTSYNLPLNVVMKFFIGSVHFTQSHAELFKTNEQKSLRDGFKDFVYSDWQPVENNLFERNSTYLKLYEGFWLVKWLECFEWQWYEMTGGNNGFVFRKNIKTELPSPMDWMNLMGYYCGRRTANGRFSLVVDLKITDDTSTGNWIRQIANDQAIKGFVDHFKTVNYVLKELERNVTKSDKDEIYILPEQKPIETVVAIENTQTVDPITERKVPEETNESLPHHSIFSTFGDLICSNGFLLGVLLVAVIALAWILISWKNKNRADYSQTNHCTSVLFTSNSLS